MCELVAAGRSFTICVDNEGCVRIMGCLVVSMFGTSFNSVPTKISIGVQIKSVAGGDNHALLLDISGCAWGMGDNRNYQIGQQNTKQYDKPHKILNLPTISSVHCGGLYSVCISEDKEFYSFGKLVSCTISKPYKSKFVSNISHVACGNSHIVIIANNIVMGMGCNQYKQLFPTDLKIVEEFIPMLVDINITDICCGENFTLLLSECGKVYGCGETMKKNQFGPNSGYFVELDLPEIITISCGSLCSMFIDIDNNIWVVGVNRYGNLGIDRCDYVPNFIQHPTLANIQYVTQGGNHAVFRDFSGTIWVCGLNDKGQLGLGLHDVTLSTPTRLVDENNNNIIGFRPQLQKSARK